MYRAGKAFERPGRTCKDIQALILWIPVHEDGQVRQVVLIRRVHHKQNLPYAALAG